MITQRMLHGEFVTLCLLMNWNTDPVKGDHYILTKSTIGDGKARYAVEMVYADSGGRHQPFGPGATWVGAQAADLALRTAIEIARLTTAPLPRTTTKSLPSKEAIKQYERRESKANNDTFAGLEYDTELAGSEGVRVILYTTPETTPKQLVAAKHEARSQRDVVEFIKVLTPSSDGND